MHPRLLIGRNAAGITLYPMRGAIAAGHTVTAEAGARVLGAGGNAVDACLAAALASWVAESPPPGPGGGGFGLVYLARDASTRVYDFFAAIPSERRGAMDEVVVDFADASTQRFHVGEASCAGPGARPGAHPPRPRAAPGARPRRPRRRSCPRRRRADAHAGLPARDPRLDPETDAGGPRRLSAAPGGRHAAPARARRHARPLRRRGLERHAGPPRRASATPRSRGLPRQRAPARRDELPRPPLPLESAAVLRRSADRLRARPARPAPAPGRARGH